MNFLTMQSLIYCPYRSHLIFSWWGKLSSFNKLYESSHMMLPKQIPLQKLKLKVIQNIASLSVHMTSPIKKNSFYESIYARNKGHCHCHETCFIYLFFKYKFNHLPYSLFFKSLRNMRKRNKECSGYNSRL